MPHVGKHQRREDETVKGKRANVNVGEHRDARKQFCRDHISSESNSFSFKRKT